MIPTTLFIEPHQEKRIQLALRKGKGCQIKTRKIVGGSLNGLIKGLIKGEMLLTQSQWKKYHTAKPGKSVTLPFLHEHLIKNMQHKGGFLPLLALLAPILGGVAGGLIEKEIGGSGLHPPKLIWCKKLAKQNTPVAFQIDSAPRGNGLYLSPWKGHPNHFKSGTGLYLSPYPHKMGSGVHFKKVEHNIPKHCHQFSPKQHTSIHHLL